MLALALIPKITNWSAVAGFTSAAIAIIALFFTRQSLRNSRAQQHISEGQLLTSQEQLKQAQSTLEDRRLDERVKAILGENILMINSLTEQARATLQEAKDSALAVQAIRSEASQTLQIQERQSDDSRQKLEDALERAYQVTAQLNQTAQKAEEDSRAISEVRETVTQFPDILRRARNVGMQEGYRITGGVNSGAMSTSMERDTGFEQRRVHIEPLILGADAEEASMLLDTVRESMYEALSHERQHYKANTHFVIVTEKSPRSITYQAARKRYLLWRSTTSASTSKM